MKELRSAMLIGAVAALALGFILILQGPPVSVGGLLPRLGPGMMGPGMGPGMMGRVGPAVTGPWQTPVPVTPTTPDAGNDLTLPGTMLMLAGGVALVAWWWAGRPPLPRDRRKETPMEIARRRYVDGEITLLEFDQIVQGLLSNEARELEPARSRNR
ncbi:MAG: hypothetical protein Q8R28_12905 [Dehalococcoidia bacterium]|nr:hypothetical protein [Dehalococcoidia bacterium]